MTRLKVSIGALLVCAACFAALGAGNAAASRLHECVKGFQGTGTKFTTSSCTTQSPTGEFETVPLSTGKHAVTATSTTPFKLKSTVFGIENEITCNTMMSSATEAENSGTEIKGEGVTEYSECSVQKPAGCKVAEPIKTVKTKGHSEDAAENKMYTKYEPVEGTTFTTITYSECGLLNGGHNVTGSARSETLSIESEEFNATSGSSLSLSGFAASLTGRYHLSTPDGTKIYRETP